MLEPESNKRPLAGESSSGNPANIKLENVRLLWLDGGAGSIPSRFLILEDTDTGDVLLPLYVVWFGDERLGDERLGDERFGGQAGAAVDDKKVVGRRPPCSALRSSVDDSDDDHTTINATQ